MWSPCVCDIATRVLFELTGDVGLESRLVALGIKWRTAALGRCEGNLRARILEDVVRRGELLQPEAGLAPGIAELVVGGQNHQDLHHALLCWGVCCLGTSTSRLTRQRCMF